VLRVIYNASVNPLRVITGDMRIRYDQKIDALYLRLDGSKAVESEEVKAGIVVDFNAQKQIVGIEVLELKRRVPAADLEQLRLLAA
jgi:uncharacterized protein YuzE